MYNEQITCIPTELLSKLPKVKEGFCSLFTIENSPYLKSPKECLSFYHDLSDKDKLQFAKQGSLIIENHTVALTSCTYLGVSYVRGDIIKSTTEMCFNYRTNQWIRVK